MRDAVLTVRSRDQPHRETRILRGGCGLTTSPSFQERTAKGLQVTEHLQVLGDLCWKAPSPEVRWVTLADASKRDRLCFLTN